MPRTGPVGDSWPRPPGLDEQVAELDPDVGALLDVLGDSPTDDDLELLRSDDRLWIPIARIDVRPWLVSWFTATADWQIERDLSGPITGTSSVGVAWSYGGVHDVAEAFNGLPATGREVVVRGDTVMGMDRYDCRFRLWRYVDWAGLYAQLGLALNWRVPVSNTPSPLPRPPDPREP